MEAYAPLFPALSAIELVDATQNAYRKRRPLAMRRMRRGRLSGLDDQSSGSMNDQENESWDVIRHSKLNHDGIKQEKAAQHNDSNEKKK